MPGGVAGERPMKAVPYADCAPGMMRCAQVLLAWRWWLAAMAARGLQQRDHTALTAAISLSVYRRELPGLAKSTP